MAAGRRVHILGLNYAPEPTGIGPYTAGLAEGLAARGHAVTVVAGKPYYPQWRPYPGQPPGRTVTRENGVTVIRCPHFIPARPGAVGRLLHHASFRRAAGPALRLAAGMGGPPDAVIAIAPSLIAAPAAAAAARAAGAKLWLHIQDFEVGAAAATGMLPGAGLALRAAHAFERRTLRACDLVSAISAPMRALAIAKGVAPEHAVELRNWANHEGRVRAGDPGPLRAQWGLEGAFVALYSGTLARKQGLEIVIEAARRLAANEALAGGRPIRIVIAGEGPPRAALEAAAADLPAVQFRDLQPEAAVGDLLMLADCHLLPQVPEAADLVLPSKLGNALMTGRPVIATAAPGTGMAGELANGAGVVVPPRDGAALAEAIAALARDPAQAARIGAAGRARAEAAWSQERVLDAWDAALADLLG